MTPEYEQEIAANLERAEEEKWNMMESKKSWVEPELIVLVRNKPEEAVLSACKNSNLSGANSQNSACQIMIDSSCPSSCAAPSSS